jgi:hypothetical protein
MSGLVIAILPGTWAGMLLMVPARGGLAASAHRQGHHGLLDMEPVLGLVVDD